nr:MAG TPA: hypothetical protein [Caudoviricetes sp.]
MVHRPNTLVRLLESFIGENPICTPLNINTLTVLRCTGYVPMWEFFY